jgi:hypothetical protein
MVIDLKHGILLMGLFLILLPFSYLYPGSKKEAAPKSQSSFGVSDNVVVVNATVTDEEGNPVTDLTANDFKAYDDGKLQNIQTFELESYGPAESQGKKSQSGSPKRTKENRNSPGQTAAKNAMPPRLLESSYDTLRNSGLAYRVELKLPIGRYKIKAVVRESTPGKIGSVTKAVEIP